MNKEIIDFLFFAFINLSERCFVMGPVSSEQGATKTLSDGQNTSKFTLILFKGIPKSFSAKALLRKKKALILYFLPL